jgi:hypothetical protein
MVFIRVKLALESLLIHILYTVVSFNSWPPVDKSPLAGSIISFSVSFLNI